MLPLYEAKMMHHYDTRWATYEPDGRSRHVTEDEKAGGVAPRPRYWVSEFEVNCKLDGRWPHGWLLGWRDVCRATDARTVISTAGPRVAYGDKWLLALPARGRHELQAVWSSFVLDFAARQKIGGTAMKYFTFMQLPVPSPRQMSESRVPLGRRLESWVSLRVERLNAWISDTDDRARVRAELDGLIFHIYGLSRSEVAYVMDAFPIVRRKDEARCGRYRTKELILEVYDAMAAAREQGRPYVAPWSRETV